MVYTNEKATAVTLALPFEALRSPQALEESEVEWALVAELVYAYGSEPYAARLVGSTPTESTKNNKL